MFDPPAQTTARFIVLVVMFFGLLGLLAALMLGIAIKLIAIVTLALIAVGGAIWLAAKLSGGGKAPGA
jgi:hypothetical protein